MNKIQYRIEYLDGVGNDMSPPDIVDTFEEAQSLLIDEWNRGEPGDGWILLTPLADLTKHQLPLTVMETHNIRGEQNLHIKLSSNLPYRSYADG